MIRTVPYVTAAAALAILFGSASLNSNGKEGRTGSPGELTCRDGCHNTFPLNSGEGSISIASNMADWQYVPGTTYQMSVTVALPSSSKFGVGLEALSDANVDAGTLVITDPSSTQIKNHSISGSIRRNVVHTTNGGLGSGSKTFTFDWVAPPSDIGPVTFYFAGNASNSGNNMSGDRIYTGTQVATPSSTVSVAELEALVEGLEVSPNPFADRFTMHYNAPEGGVAELRIMDVSGRLLHSATLAPASPGRHTAHVEGLDLLPEGVLFVHLTLNGRTQVKRVVRAAR